MKKIKKYNLCWNSSASGLSEDVNQYIEWGYQPYGEPFMNQNPHGDYYYCQAMVQYSQDPYERV